MTGHCHWCGRQAQACEVFHPGPDDQGICGWCLRDALIRVTGGIIPQLDTWTRVVPLCAARCMRAGDPRPFESSKDLPYEGNPLADGRQGEEWRYPVKGNTE